MYVWLNNNYYNSTFSDEEKSLIVDKGYGKVFLLSTDEATNYFKSDDARIAKYKGSSCFWWLRSPGSVVKGVYGTIYTAAYVGTSGYVYGPGNDVSPNLGVRPALWLNLES